MLRLYEYVFLCGDVVCVFEICGHQCVLLHRILSCVFSGGVCILDVSSPVLAMLCHLCMCRVCLQHMCSIYPNFAWCTGADNMSVYYPFMTL